MTDFDLYLFLLFAFLYSLWNLFVFVRKNIHWRLSSMKLVLWIMLYWIPFQSGLYTASFYRAIWSWFIHTCKLIYIYISIYLYVYLYLSLYIYNIYIYKYIYIYFIYTYIYNTYIYLYMYHIYIMYNIYIYMHIYMYKISLRGYSGYW